MHIELDRTCVALNITLLFHALRNVHHLVLPLTASLDVWAPANVYTLGRLVNGRGFGAMSANNGCYIAPKLSAAGHYIQLDYVQLRYSQYNPSVQLQRLAAIWQLAILTA